MPEIAILGAGGRLGAALAQQWEARGMRILSVPRDRLNVADPAALAAFLQSLRADWLFNCTGLTNLETCEEQPGEAMRINANAVEQMAVSCAGKSMRFVHFSTDYVFDGHSDTPLDEQAPAAPLGAYGKSKLAGEQAALAGDPGAYVFRISWVFGPHRPAFPDSIVRRATETDDLRVVCDKWASPTYTLDAASWLVPLFSKCPPEPGLYHICNSGVCSWVEYASHALLAAKKAGVPVRTTTPIPVRLADMPMLSAPRPVYSALNTKKFQNAFGIKPRPWQDALDEHFAIAYRP